MWIFSLAFFHVRERILKLKYSISSFGIPQLQEIACLCGFDEKKVTKRRKGNSPQIIVDIEIGFYARTTPNKIKKLVRAVVMAHYCLLWKAFQVMVYCLGLWRSSLVLWKLLFVSLKNIVSFLWINFIVNINLFSLRKIQRIWDSWATEGNTFSQMHKHVSILCAIATENIR